MSWILNLLIVGMIAVVVFNAPYEKVDQVTNDVKQRMLDNINGESIIDPLWVLIAYGSDFIIDLGVKLGEMFGWYGIIALLAFGILGVTGPGIAWLVFAVYFYKKNKKEEKELWNNVEGK